MQVDHFVVQVMTLDQNDVGGNDGLQEYYVYVSLLDVFQESWDQILVYGFSSSFVADAVVWVKK